MEGLEAMRFPINDRDISEFPKLQRILDKHGEENEDILRWVVYRFDSKCEAVQELDSVEEKREAAFELSEMTPEDMEGRGDVYEDMATDFFRTLNSSEYELYCSGEIALSQIFRKLREPIEPSSGEETKDMEEDKEHRAFLLKTQLHEKAAEMIARQKEILSRITDDDEGQEAIQSARNSRLISPEARANVSRR